MKNLNGEGVSQEESPKETPNTQPSMDITQNGKPLRETAGVEESESKNMKIEGNNITPNLNESHETTENTNILKQETRIKITSSETAPISIENDTRIEGQLSQRFFRSEPDLSLRLSPMKSKQEVTTSMFKRSESQTHTKVTHAVIDNRKSPNKCLNPAQSVRSASESSYDSMSSHGNDDLDEEMSWKERMSWLLRIFVSNKIKWLFCLITLIFISIAIVYEEFQPDRAWSTKQVVPVWRWFLYLGLGFPCYIFSEMFVVFVTYILKQSITLKAVQEEEILSKVLHNTGLFFRRYSGHILFFVWTCMLTISWTLCFRLKTLGAIRKVWSVQYENLLNIHFILMLWSASNIIVRFIEFKYLTQFSAKTLSQRMIDSIFEQVVISGLLGYCQVGSEMLFLPSKLFEWAPSMEDGDERENRQVHSAQQYLLKNRMENIFALRLGLVNEKKAFVVNVVSKRLRSRIRERITTKHSNQITTIQLKTQDLNANNVNNETIQKQQANTFTNGSSNVSLKLPRKLKQVSKQVLSDLLVESYGDAINVERALKFLDSSDSEKDTIPLKLVEMAIDRSFTDRRNLITALKDAKTVAIQVKRWIQVIANAMVILVSLFFFGISTAEAWVGFSTVVLGFSFVFGPAVKTTFENVLFLYGSHPYDVGDTIRLGPQKELYKIKRVWLRTTEMENPSGEIRTIQNATISTIEPLFNLSKSSTHWLNQSYVLDVSIVTSEFKNLVSEDMKKFFEKHPEMYNGTFRIDTREFLPPMKINLTLGFELPFAQKTFGPSRVAQSFACLEFARSIERHGGTYTPYREYMDAKLADQLENY